MESAIKNPPSQDRVCDLSFLNQKYIIFRMVLAAFRNPNPENVTRSFLPIKIRLIILIPILQVKELQRRRDSSNLEE